MVRARALKIGDHAGEEKIVPEPLVNSAQRRKLGDITNIQDQNKLANQGAKQQQQATLVSSKENAENLQKEHVMQLVAERDGIKSELRELRIHFQKVKEQNSLLAQENSRILAELNTSKDKLKVIHHELGCKNGLVMVRKIKLKEQTLPRTCHVSKVKPNDADHENVSASESSNANSLQTNVKANNKRRVSGRTNPAALDIIGRPGETCQKGDNIDNKELGFFQNLNGLHDDQDIAATAGCSASNQSIGSRPEAGEPHDTKEITGKSRVSRRRQSARINFQELGVTENLNSPNDDQAITANTGCSANEQFTGCKSEAVEPYDMTETTGENRDSSRIQSANVKTPSAIKETADPPLHDDIVDESSPVLCTVSMKVKRESKNKLTGDESEETIKTSIGRRSRQAAEKIKSYKEPSLKEKMRRDF